MYFQINPLYTPDFVLPVHASHILLRLNPPPSFSTAVADSYSCKVSPVFLSHLATRLALLEMILVLININSSFSLYTHIDPLHDSCSRRQHFDIAPAGVFVFFAAF
jgi:hypothetical protein